MCLWAGVGHSQEVRIVTLDSVANLGFVLRDTGTATSFVCTVEWCMSLEDGWTSAWYRAFEAHSPSNGVSTVKLPRFFRIICEEGSKTNEAGTAYDVVEVVPSSAASGKLSWSNTSGTGTTHHVEYAASPGGPWRGDWGLSTNILTPTVATNHFAVPLYFRVVKIKANDGGEIPW